MCMRLCANAHFTHTHTYIYIRGNVVVVHVYTCDACLNQTKWHRIQGQDGYNPSIYRKAIRQNRRRLKIKPKRLKGYTGTHTHTFIWITCHTHRWGVYCIGHMQQYDAVTFIFVHVKLLVLNANFSGKNEWRKVRNCKCITLLAVTHKSAQKQLGSTINAFSRQRCVFYMMAKRDFD